MAAINLSRFNNRSFKRGSGPLKEAFWLVIRQCLFLTCPFSLSSLKGSVLRAFGARVGQGVVIKPGVKITFPWKLEVGDHVWLGEEAWLLNLDRIEIQSHVCISQRALLCTGSHDYHSPAFELVVKPIVVGQGSWICAGATVLPGVNVGQHAILSAGSVATGHLKPFGIYQGNPASHVRTRTIGEQPRREPA